MITSATGAGDRRSCVGGFDLLEHVAGEDGEAGGIVVVELDDAAALDEMAVELRRPGGDLEVCDGGEFSRRLDLAADTRGA